MGAFHPLNYLYAAVLWLLILDGAYWLWHG
jgi:hypothetical protein